MTQVREPVDPLGYIARQQRVRTATLNLTARGTAMNSELRQFLTWGMFVAAMVGATIALGF
jgi:hypothetical protein